MQPFFNIGEVHTQSEKTIKLEGVNFPVLTGPNDRNLRLIETKFDARFTMRGDRLILKGEVAEVECLEKVFTEMIGLINRSGKISDRDIETIISLAKHGKNSLVKDNPGNILLYTQNDVIRAKTAGQIEFIRTESSNDIIFVIGPAGTGKTFLAVAFAVSALKKGLVEKIVLARPAVEAGESLGFLPGDLREKIDPYLRPLYDSLQDMLPRDQLKTFIERGIIEIVPLAYMRGRTLNRAYVILDEAQNATTTQMKMFLTRIGPNSKAIITGDITQIDLPSKKESGLVQVNEILKNIEGVGFVYLEKTDVMRHRLVKEIINAYEDYQGSQIG